MNKCLEKILKVGHCCLCKQGIYDNESLVFITATISRYKPGCLLSDVNSYMAHGNCWGKILKKKEKFKRGYEFVRQT